MATKGYHIGKMLEPTTARLISYIGTSLDGDVEGWGQLVLPNTQKHFPLHGAIFPYDVEDLGLFNFQVFPSLDSSMIYTSRNDLVIQARARGSFSVCSKGSALLKSAIDAANFSACRECLDALQVSLEEGILLAPNTSKVVTSVPSHPEVVVLDDSVSAYEKKVDISHRFVDGAIKPVDAYKPLPSGKSRVLRKRLSW